MIFLSKRLALILIIVFLSFFDMIATGFALKEGYIIELNPIMNYLWNTTHHYYFYLFKIVSTFFAAIIFFIFYDSSPKLVKVGIKFTIFILCFVVILHFNWISKYLF